MVLLRARYVKLNQAVICEEISHQLMSGWRPKSSSPSSSESLRTEAGAEPCIDFSWLVRQGLGIEVTGCRFSSVLGSLWELQSCHRGAIEARILHQLAWNVSMDSAQSARAATMIVG